MTRETYSNEGPVCPHCAHQFTADEGCYYDESNYTSDECPECEKPFAVEVCISTYWTCKPIEDEA